MDARTFFAILALATSTSCTQGQGVFLETEAFENHGGWALDQQFMDRMGSPYLLAHGMGEPVADASTTFEVPENGRYHIYARTYNWTAPWTRKDGPGAFRLLVDGKGAGRTLGTKGSSWGWQRAGSMRLKKGTAKVSLHDLGGFDGRCDAIWISPSRQVPPAGGKELEDFRRAYGAISAEPTDGGEYDLVVVGAGIGGMCTAVSAARHGLRVALVSDRPAIGGNNSSEVRVHLGGGTEMEPYPALGRMIREFGHSRKGNAQSAENYEDWKKDAFIEGEPNVTLMRCFRAVRVEKDGDDMIAAVIVRSTVSGEEKRLRAPLFCDCTGDGNLGYMAGADWRMGRESRAEFGEPLAPEQADSTVLGASVQWYSVETDAPAAFPEFNYGMAFSEESCERVKMGEWTWENGMNRNQVTEAERIRDYGLLVIYSNWSFLKNHFSGKDEYACRKLGWVAYVAGKRESRRLMGDHILTQCDIIDQKVYDDASFTINWHLDLHFPDPRNAKFFPGEEFKAKTKHNPIETYAVPYRCLYSRNIRNLFMAGRDISVSHVALGSARLMRNIGMAGEVVGMAASICARHDALPRDVYTTYLPELKALMLKGSSKEGPIPDNQKFNFGDNNRGASTYRK